MGTNEAAVAAVRHIAAGAAGARTGTHIAPRGALGFRLCAEDVQQVEKERSAQEEVHGWLKRSSALTVPLCASEEVADRNPRAWESENKAKLQEQRHESLVGRLAPATVRLDGGTEQQKSGFGFCRRRREGGRGGGGGKSGGVALTCLCHPL